jgi:hypothetical protein
MGGLAPGAPLGGVPTGGFPNGGFTFVAEVDCIVAVVSVAAASVAGVCLGDVDEQAERTSMRISRMMRIAFFIFISPNFVIRKS